VQRGHGLALQQRRAPQLEQAHDLRGQRLERALLRR
jgi:hypothetical protein